MSDLNPIRTPCIGVCSTGIGDAVSRGCKRFAHEVIDWNGYSQAQKQAIDARLDRFLAMCVANKLRIVDQKLLDWQLSVQKIRHQPHHDPYCHLFALLKAGATQILSPSSMVLRCCPVAETGLWWRLGIRSTRNSGSFPPRTMTAISPPVTCSRTSRLKKPPDELD